MTHKTSDKARLRQQSLGKNYPPPLVSLGKIIGCKIAGLEVVNKTRNLLVDFMNKRFSTTEVYQESHKANDNQNVQQTTIINLIQSSPDSLLGEKCDTNLNAMQGRESATNVATARARVTKTRRSRRLRNHGRLVSRTHFQARRKLTSENALNSGIPIAKSQTPCSTGLEVVPSMSRPLAANDPDPQQVAGPDSKVPALKSLDSVAGTSRRMEKKNENKDRQKKLVKIAERQAKDDAKNLSSIQKLKNQKELYAKLEKRIKFLENLPKREEKTKTKSNARTKSKQVSTGLQASRDLATSGLWPKTLPRTGSLLSSQSCGSLKHRQEKKTSPQVTNPQRKVMSQKATSPKLKEKEATPNPPFDKATGGYTLVRSFSEHKSIDTKQNVTAFNKLPQKNETVKSWASVAKGLGHNTPTFTKQGEGHLANISSPLSVGPSSAKFKTQLDFPSLEEAKDRKQRGTKAHQVRRSEKPDLSHLKNGNKTISSVNRTNRKHCTADNSRSVLSKKRRRKRKEGKRKRRQAELLRRDAAESTRLASFPSQTDSSTGCSWFIDDMQEVVTQPVSKVVPLHDASTAAAKPDICNRLKAISMEGESECSHTMLGSCLRRKNDPPSKLSKQTKTRPQKESGKAPAEESGTTQKKVSTRYRALLRRNHGRVDLKTATQMFTRAKWRMNHQKDRLCSKFESQRQRRGSLVSSNTGDSKDFDDPAEGTSRRVHWSNETFTFFGPTEQGCPTM